MILWTSVVESMDMKCSCCVNIKTVCTFSNKRHVRKYRYSHQPPSAYTMKLQGTGGHCQEQQWHGSKQAKTLHWLYAFVCLHPSASSGILYTYQLP
jgi:hypothetical protein